MRTRNRLTASTFAAAALATAGATPAAGSWIAKRRPRTKSDFNITKEKANRAGARPRRGVPGRPGTAEVNPAAPEASDHNTRRANRLAHHASRVTIRVVPLRAG